VKIVDQTYLIKLYATYEKIKQAQLGADSHTRHELKQLQNAVKEKIINLENKMKKIQPEPMV
jgi:hypothetical protein